MTLKFDKNLILKAYKDLIPSMLRSKGERFTEPEWNFVLSGIEWSLKNLNRIHLREDGTYYMTDTLERTERLEKEMYDINTCSVCGVVGNCGHSHYKPKGERDD